jgi:ribosomal protein S18 acetylase RimI-like enzyme
MIIRDATGDEVESLARIWFDGWQDAHTKILPAELARHRTMDSFRERMAAAIADVRVAGPKTGSLGFAMIKGNELYQLYVAAAGRGTGVASALNKDAIAHIRGNGFKTAWLACATGNERAARFYEKSGWHRTGTITSELDTPAGLFPLDVWRYEIDIAI